jgi:hypothetical protein
MILEKKIYKSKYFVFYWTNSFDISYEVCGYYDSRPRINLDLIFFSLAIILPFRNEKWANECISPKYGISIHSNTFWIYRGGKGNMNGGNKWWTWYIPFITKEWVRTSILLNDGSWENETKGNRKDFYKDEWKEKQKCWEYNYTDSYDGKVVPTKIYVDEREWRPKWLTWTSLFAKKIRTIDIHFSEEVGSRKGSWKGGVLGCGYNLLPNEEPLDCLKRMEKERKL